MQQKLPTRRMRTHPDLEQIKRQARELLRGFTAGEPDAVAEVHSHYREADPSRFALHDAQLVIARSYGFASWPRLKSFVDGVTIRRLADAIQKDELPVVQAMLAARPELADMSMSYGDERQPIHFAVMRRSAGMVRLLMHRGANARSGVHPHRDATQAWTLAKERGYEEIVAIIEEEEQKRGSRKREQPAETQRPDESLRQAVASGDIEAIAALHRSGNLENPVRWDGGGLLTVAVRHNRPEMLKLLLGFGFDPNERVSIGEGDWMAYSQGYPLWHAAALGREEMAEMLLDSGADPNVHVDSSGSSVHSAYSHRQWEMAELLRKRGGVVSADTAAIYRQTELARQMLEDDSRGVLHKLVSPAKPVAEELLHFGACGGDPKIVRMALEQVRWPPDDLRWLRCLMEPLSFWNHIPWLYAANPEFDRATYIVCFRRILERCDPNIVGGFRRTALHEVAAMGDHVTGAEAAEFASALLEAGAKTGIRDEILESTPLGWACRWGRAGVVRVLLESGADPEEPDAEAWAKPIRWAEKMGHPEIVEMLQSTA